MMHAGAQTTVPSSHRLGENGHAELTAEGLGDPLLALFDKTVRGLDEARISSFVADIIAEARTKGDAEPLKNLFVLAFQTRWCRGGKGERKIFYHLLMVLYERYAAVVVDLVQLIPTYGCWKDLLSLLLECKHGNVDYAPLRHKVWNMFACQLKADEEELAAATRQGRSPKLSLAAKYAPSQGGQHSRVLKADKEIYKILFPAFALASSEAASAKYRRLLSSLRRALAVPEVLMCAQKWAEINFAKVSSLCLDRHKRAFLNEGKDRARDNLDRLACREHLLEMIAEKGVSGLKGKQLFPHELVQQVLNPKRGDLSDAVCAILNIQWEAVRNGLLEMVEARKAEQAQESMPVDNVEALVTASKLCAQSTVLSVALDVAIDSAVSSSARKPVGLSRVVAMVDVSGSMSGTPMEAAIALGILTSEVTHPVFRDRVLTFSADPQWHDLSKETTFVQKVQSLERADWDMNTDFLKAMQKIAELVKNERLEQHDIPDLLVISDMQFDEAELLAAGGRKTAHEKIVELFASVGMQVHGHPLQPPNIIFWNVRADTVGYPAAAEEKGVMLLSGFSPSLMKFILSGEMEEECITLDEDGKIVKSRAQVDPRETLRRVLYDSGLDDVRSVLEQLPALSWLA
jgi:Mg-chelatase subunit ChlD